MRSLLVLGFWQWAYSMNFKPDYVLPSPATVFATIGNLFASGRAFEVLWTSCPVASSGSPFPW